MGSYAVFWKKLGVMLTSGVPLVTALEVLRGEVGHEGMEAALERAIEGLGRGEGFGQALGGAEAVVGAQVVAMIRSAEEAGRLDEVILRLGEQVEAGVWQAPETGARPEPRSQPAGPSWEALVGRAVASGASDVHLEATAEGGQVRFRVDGSLSVHETLARGAFVALIAGLKAASCLDVGERRIPQDGRIRIEVEGESGLERVDIRVSVGPTVSGESASLRILKPGPAIEAMTRQELIFPDEAMREAIYELTSRSHGLFLATGPTGSGKTTTVYALLSRCDPERLKIMTIEDPVELHLAGVHQIPLNMSLGLSHTSALRHAMRMDPDVLFCSEIRDVETAELLLRVALTGHLVFSQLHSRDATEALMRLYHTGLEPHLLADTLLGVVGQRLVRRLCSACARPSAEQREKAGALYGADRIPEGARIMEPVGCEACQGRGFRGRMPIYELLTMSPRLQGVLYRRPDADALRQALQDEPFSRMFETALVPLCAGETTVTEIMRVCPRPV